MDRFEDHDIYLPPGASGDVAILCPRCSSGRKHKHDKCLSVNVEKGVWQCHHPHCNWKGRLKEDSHNTLKPVSSTKPSPREKKLLDTTRTISATIPPLSQDAIELLKMRGISVSTAMKSGIGTENGKILFPLRNEDGDIVNVKYRKIKEKSFHMVSGGDRILYNVYGATRARIESPHVDNLVWVEGEMDVLACIEAGINNVVSVPDGAPAPTTKDYSNKFEFLERCESFVKQYRTHTIAVDSDLAGRKLGEELARRIGPEKCKIVNWPDPIKDANQMLIDHGANALRSAVNTARDFPVRGIHDISSIMEGVFEIYEHGDEPGLSTRWRSLDELYTCRQGEVTVITGVPNHGKSEWLDALITNLAILHGWHTAICSPENRPLKRHFSKLASKYTGKPFNPGPSERMTHKELAKAIAWANQHFTFILPEDDEMTIDNLINLGKILVYRKGIQALVIDPWGDMVHRFEQGENESGYIGRMLTKIRQFSRDHNVHVFIVAHPKQLVRTSTGNFPIPTPYDISGSAHWRNKPDNCICVWREDTLNKEAGGGSSDTIDGDAVEIHIQKVRFKQIGRQGKRPLYYDRVTGIYYSTKDGLAVARSKRKTAKGDR